MSVPLFLEALLKFLAGVLLVGVILFASAGTFCFFSAWLLMGILFVPLFVAGIVMMVKNPALLQKRLRAKERQKGQDRFQKLGGLMFVCMFVLAGLGVRFDWYTLPRGVILGGAVVFLAAYALYAEVLRENAFLSRTVEVQAGQTVVTTGLYGIVRHPMYAVTLLLFLAMAVVLGSLFSLAVLAVYPVLIVFRIRGEEELLVRELDGYAAYQQTVKYRLIPFVW